RWCTERLLVLAEPEQRLVRVTALTGVRVELPQIAVQRAEHDVIDEAALAACDGHRTARDAGRRYRTTARHARPRVDADLLARLPQLRAGLDVDRGHDTAGTASTTVVGLHEHRVLVAGRVADLA